MSEDPTPGGIIRSSSGAAVDESAASGTPTQAGYHPEIADRPVPAGLRRRGRSSGGDKDSPASGQQGTSLVTVLVALAANLGVAIAKSIAAIMTGSASMVAEAAHSWADTGNEILLLLAERRSGRPADRRHPMGYGREAYVWSMFAALGLFTVGAVVSISHGISQLRHPEEGDPHYLLNYVILAIAFVLEGSSFLQATRQARTKAAVWNIHPLRFVSQSSDPTLRAVFFEDSSALVGLLIAALGIGLHEITGQAAFDAIGSILIGLLLAVIALFLIDRNRRFLVGESLSPQLMVQTLNKLLEHPEIDRVTYLHVEFVGPQRLFVVAAVDLTGNDPETRLARRLRDLEAMIERQGSIADAVLTLATPDEKSLTPESFLAQHDIDDPAEVAAEAAEAAAADAAGEDAPAEAAVDPAEDAGEDERDVQHRAD